jgi:branched-chain amino acid transport system ATP-binding protein
MLRERAGAQASPLSGGQQTLLEIARALRLDPALMLIAEPAIGLSPRLVLLDEPAGGVNPTMLVDLRERLEAINRETRATFVVIEHNMEFVMALCTRVLVLAEGRIIAEGTPSEIRANPAVVEAYLGG